MDIDKKINNIINGLKKKYPVFVSERHLQVAFSIEVSNVISGCKLYPEYSFDRNRRKTENNKRRKNEYIDLVIETNKKKFAFEFKYPVCYFEGDVNNRHIKLRHQSAWFGRRYDCLKDIERLENLKKDKEVDGGYFILITNYKGFWDKSEGKKTKDREFRFANGIKQGEKKWSEDTGGTKKGREKGISIKYSYSVSFESFSDIKSANGNTKFKVLIVKVK